MAEQNAIAEQAYNALDRATAVANSLRAPLGRPAVLAPAAPASEAQTYSFTAADPLITENESRLQQVEEALRNSEAHALMMQDRALEHEEQIRRLTSSYEASRAQAEMNREDEAHEYERQLTSERSAKMARQLDI